MTEARKSRVQDTKEEKRTKADITPEFAFNDEGKRLDALANKTARLRAMRQAADDVRRRSLKANAE